MKNIMMIISVILIFSCAGKTGHVKSQSIGEGIIKKDYGIHKSGQITFSTTGPPIYNGRPSTLVFYAYSVSVNIDAIQKVSAKHILQSIYNDVKDAGDSSQIISEIRDFEYKWPAFNFSSRAIVSFNLHLHIKDKDGNVNSKTIVVKDFEGSDNKVFMAGALFGVIGSSLSGNVDERSQMVSNAVLEAVHNVYEKDLIGVIETLN